jgi:hypothetical protein
MSLDFRFIDSHIKLHQAELRKEADNDRLAALSRAPARPLRSSVARWLRASARWIEGGAARPVVHAEA